MPKKKKVYQKRVFESDGRSNDISSNLYFSMLTHPAYKDLSPKQQQLYTYCKLQYYAQSGRRAVDQADNSKFYFNRSLWQDIYCLYSKSNQSSFYKDMAKLIENGFIKCIESGKTTRTKSIYQFSNMWQKWNTEEFKILPCEMNSRLLKSLSKVK